MFSTRSRCSRAVSLTVSTERALIYGVLSLPIAIRELEMTIDRRRLILSASTLAILGAPDVSESEPHGADMNNTKERVLGIGGLFFRSRDPKALAEWYQRHLGIDPTPTDYQQPVWQQAAGPTVFSPFPADTEYFGSPQQAWMVNFRVRNLDAMIMQLRASSIAVKVDSEVYPNGRFARLHDPDGNPIELWEPAVPNAHSKMQPPR
jgi:glyoxylase I family protein